VKPAKHGFPCAQQYDEGREFWRVPLDQLVPCPGLLLAIALVVSVAALVILSSEALAKAGISSSEALAKDGSIPSQRSPWTGFRVQWSCRHRAELGTEPIPHHMPNSNRLRARRRLPDPDLSEHLLAGEHAMVSYRWPTTLKAAADQRLAGPTCC